MRKFYGLAIALLMAVFLVSGCAGPGAVVKSHIVMPGGETATIVAHDQWAPDWALNKKCMELNYIASGSDVTPKQQKAVEEIENAGREYTQNVRPDNAVVVLADMCLYGALGGAAIGVGSLAFPGTSFWEYFGYGAAGNGLVGAVPGALSLEGNIRTFDKFQ